MYVLLALATRYRCLTRAGRSSAVVILPDYLTSVDGGGVYIDLEDRENKLS